MAGLTQLKDLDLPGSGIIDLSAVKGMTELEYLKLGGPGSVVPEEERTEVTPLASLTKLTWLTLPGAIDDAGLKQLAQLPKIGILSVRGRGITDAGLASLASTPSLGRLDLRHTSVRDFRSLGPKLREMAGFVIDDAPITDENLSALEGLPKLIYIGLSGTKITDRGMKHLEGLGKLKLLALKRTEIGDEGLASVAGMTSLTQLLLDETRITDAGLKHLAGMTRLRFLDLNGTAITDAAVPDLAKLTSCGAIGVYRTKMTPAGLARLKRLLPNTVLRNNDRNAL